MIPCQDCLCFAVCRNKRYVRLLKSCDLIKKYVLHNVPGSIPLHRHRVIELLFTLKPKLWSIKCVHKDNGFTICASNNPKLVVRDEYIGIKELKCLRGW